jgi:hypothetical protein
MMRRLWSWHEEPALLEWAATAAGRVLLWGAAAVLVPAAHRWPLVPLLGLSFIFPARRTELLALGAFWVLYDLMPEAVRTAGWPSIALVGAFMLGLLWVTYGVARRLGGLPPVVRRRALVWTHVALLGLTAAAVLLPRAAGIARSSPLGAAGGAVRVLIPFVLWRASYLMRSGRRGTAGKSKFREHLLYWFPVWGGSPTPYGKGYEYLQAHSAATDAELAQARLAGVKLLLLAWCWTGVLWAFELWLHGGTIPPWASALTAASLGLPDLANAIHLGPAAFSLGARWGILGGEFIGTTLQFAIGGHFIIGGLRLFGFRVFRNTYKPLLATTIVEFWNRFYYYFKELLVEFFFYPIFVATARRPQGTRIVLAVMGAAGLGNLYYHLVRDFPEYFLYGKVAMFERVSGRAVYSGLLGLGIVASMLRERRRRGSSTPPTRGAGPWALRLRAMLGVWLFYSLLHIWNVGLTRLTLAQRTRFLLSLVGLGPCWRARARAVRP